MRSAQVIASRALLVLGNRSWVVEVVRKRIAGEGLERGDFAPVGFLTQHHKGRFTYLIELQAADW